MVHVHRMLQSHPLLTSVCGLLGNNPIDSLPQLCEWYNTDKAGHVSPSGCSNEPLLLFAVGYILSNWCHCWLPFSWLLLFSERVDDFKPFVIFCRRRFVFCKRPVWGYNMLPRRESVISFPLCHAAVLFLKSLIKLGFYLYNCHAV